MYEVGGRVLLGCPLHGHSVDLGLVERLSSAHCQTFHRIDTLWKSLPQNDLL